LRLVHWLVVLSLFTASFDVILSVNVGGSLRFSQAVMIAVCFAALARMLQTGTVLWPRGSTALVLWIFIQALFVPLSGVMTIGFEFFAMLVFTAAGLFAIIQLYGQSNRIESLMRMYLLSYVFVASAGLLQFVLPVLHLPSFLVTQWIVHDRLARINAFSYEPSYFATYLILGWIMLVELRFSNARITRGRGWMVATILVTAALFLSSSKTAWVFMIVEFLARMVPRLWSAFRGLVRQLREGHILIRVPGRKLVFQGIVLCCILVAGAAALSRVVKDPAVFLSGTGLASQPAHSLNTRLDVARQTLEAYKEHPFIGRSLGGVSIYIASRDGLEVTSMEMVRKFWGFPVIMDVLVASGLFGFIPFLVFLYVNTFGALKLATRHWPQERARWLRALARAMIFEWMLLMADQNLLRVYLWYHFAMVALVAYQLEFATVPVTISRPTMQTADLGGAASAL
jgi:O-antigen ligase